MLEEEVGVHPGERDGIARGGSDAVQHLGYRQVRPRPDGVEDADRPLLEQPNRPFGHVADIDVAHQSVGVAGCQDFSAAAGCSSWYLPTIFSGRQISSYSPGSTSGKTKRPVSSGKDIGALFLSSLAMVEVPSVE